MRDQRRERRRRRHADERVGEPFVEVRRRDDAGDAGVERELQDDAPHRRRRVLHGVHQPRRRAVQQEAERAGTIRLTMLRLIALSGSARLREVAHEIRAAERHDEPRQERRVLEPRAGRRSVAALGCAVRLVDVAEVDAEVARGPAAAGRRRREPHHAP